MRFVIEFFGSTKWAKDSKNGRSTIEGRKKKTTSMIKKGIKKFK